MKVAQREEEGRGGRGATAGHMRRRRCRFLFWRHLPCPRGVYGKGNGSGAQSQAGNRRRERSIKAIGTSGQKHRKRKRKSEGGDQWAGVWESVKPKGGHKKPTSRPQISPELALSSDSFGPHKTGSCMCQADVCSDYATGSYSRARVVSLMFDKTEDPFRGKFCSSVIDI